MSWLKFDTATPEKPEVFSITLALGWDDPDLTVGKLLKVWRWFDLHSVDGNAPSVTLALLDRLIGVTGLSQAMVDVGWLEVSDNGLTLPNFEIHNGKTAKDRALTAKRAANYRSNDKSNAPSVTTALPREEKRREEKKEDKKKVAPLCVAVSVLVEKGFDEQTAEEFIAHKIKIKAPLTARAWSDHLSESEKAGWTPKAAAEKVMAKNWKSFEAKYVVNEPKQSTFTPPSPAITTPSREATDPIMTKAIQESMRTLQPVTESYKSMKNKALGVAA